MLSTLKHRMLLRSQKTAICSRHISTRSGLVSPAPPFRSGTGQQRWDRMSRSRKKVLFIIGGSTTATIGFMLYNNIGEHAPANELDVQALSQIPLSKLLTGWLAFAFCSSSIWVDVSEKLYIVLSGIPIVSSVTRFFVMKIFFNEFLGGETLEECVPKILALRNARVGTLLGYNVEAELDGSSKDINLIKAQTEEVLASIISQGQLAERFCRDTSATGGDNQSWVRIKITGLLPNPVALLHGSQAILTAAKARGLDQDVPYPGLPHDGNWKNALSGDDVTDADRKELSDLYAIVDKIMATARDHNVRVVIDAEQTWYQPVIDSLTDEFMRKYNTQDGPATCIASFQAYLRRYPQLLDQQIRRAEEKGYKLLFKQVRGAYIKTEEERWTQEGRGGPSPVWGSKEETDQSFNYGVQKALATIKQHICTRGQSNVGVIFATHNSASVELGMELLEKYGLAERRDSDNKLIVHNEAAGSVAFGQIYGMKNDLTNTIAGSICTEDGFPLVIKSMSYGDLKECLPFLARRATENKAILEGRGGAAAERIRLGREIRRRALPWTEY